MNSICRCKPLLGTYVEVTIIGEASRDTLIDMSIAAYAQIEKIQSLMSFHDPDSELYQLNRSAYKQACQISAETEAVLLQALEVSRRSDGLFDISIAPQLIRSGLLPDHGIATEQSANWQDIKVANGKVSFEKKMLLDLGGIAKGYAVDKAISVFDDDVNVIINAGGDVRMSHWRDQIIHLRHPDLRKNKTLATVMRAPAVATSAGYYSKGINPIVSPKTTRVADDPCSYSVFAPGCMLADALTKIAFLSDARQKVIKSFGAELVSIDMSGSLTLHQEK